MTSDLITRPCEHGGRTCHTFSRYHCVDAFPITSFDHGRCGHLAFQSDCCIDDTPCRQATVHSTEGRLNQPASMREVRQRLPPNCQVTLASRFAKCILQYDAAGHLPGCPNQDNSGQEDFDRVTGWHLYSSWALVMLSSKKNLANTRQGKTKDALVAGRKTIVRFWLSKAIEIQKPYFSLSRR